MADWEMSYKLEPPNKHVTAVKTNTALGTQAPVCLTAPGTRLCSTSMCSGAPLGQDSRTAHAVSLDLSFFPS